MWLPISFLWVGLHPPERYTEVLAPVAVNVTLCIKKKFFADVIKLKSSHQGHPPNMTVVPLRHTEMNAKKKKKTMSRCRNWSDAAKSQGMPRIARSQEDAGEDSPLQVSEGAWPYLHQA